MATLNSIRTAFNDTKTYVSHNSEYTQLVKKVREIWYKMQNGEIECPSGKTAIIAKIHQIVQMGTNVSSN